MKLLRFIQAFFVTGVLIGGACYGMEGAGKKLGTRRIANATRAVGSQKLTLDFKEKLDSLPANEKTNLSVLVPHILASLETMLKEGNTSSKDKKNKNPSALQLTDQQKRSINRSIELALRTQLNEFSKIIKEAGDKSKTETLINNFFESVVKVQKELERASSNDLLKHYVNMIVEVISNYETQISCIEVFIRAREAHKGLLEALKELKNLKEQKGIVEQECYKLAEQSQVVVEEAERRNEDTVLQIEKVKEDVANFLAIKKKGQEHLKTLEDALENAD